MDIDIRTGLNLEHVQLAKEIDDKNDFATLIINASMDGIVACDMNGRYTLWNQAMERISGIKKEQVLGKNAFELFPFLKESGLHAAFQESLTGRTIKTPPIPYHVLETGIQGFTEQTNSPIFNDHGEIVGVLIVVRDVTETKRLIDELNEKNKVLEERIKRSQKRRIIRSSDQARSS